MKKLILLSSLLTLSISSWAQDCSNLSTSPQIQKCLTNEIVSLKKQLNSVYNALNAQTDAKLELDKAQKAWLNYKEVQCGEFTVADAGPSNGQIIYDLDCQTQLYKSRISYLKSITHK